MEDVIELLRQGEVRWVDVGATTRELFLSHRSYGFLQRVQEMVEASRLPASRLGRHLAYYGMARRVLEQTSLPSIRVEADGRLLTEAAVLVTVANVVTYRGFLSLTPSASPTDGLFDVFIVPRTTKARLLGRLVRLMLHLPGRWRGAIRCRAQRVAVTVTGEAREELRVLRHALPVLVPAGRVAAAAPAPRRAAAAGGAARPAS
jgi:diacylglycerol kinase family enzyme